MWESRIVGYETINPEQVLANPQNFRTHPESQAAPMRAVLSDVGIVQNIIINRTTGHLIDGHLRVMEALKAGQSELPATIVELSPDEEKLILATYDHLSSLAGIDVAQLDALLRDVSSDNADIQAMISEFAESEGVLDALMDSAMIEGDGGDEFDVTPESVPERANLGDLWLIGGKHRLLVGDCTDVDAVNRLMGSERANATVTDPPYGVGIDYDTFDDTLESTKQLIRNFMPIALQYQPVALTPGTAAMWAYPEPAYVGGWVHPAATGMCSWGFTGLHPILYYGKDPYLQKGMGSRNNTLVLAAQRDEDLNHPVPKPIDVWLWLVERVTTEKEQIVFDPFLGSGTTLIAAHRLGRRCFGMELGPRYADVILARAEAEGLTVVRIEENVTTTVD